MTPQELLATDDDEFRRIVDQDLRSRSSAEHTAGLRTQLVVGRWYSVLRSMLYSIEGQLAAREAEYRAQELEHSDPEELRQIGSEYNREQSKKLRFKSSVEQMLSQAEYLRATYSPELNIVRKERDDLLVRVRELETAIYEHRSNSYVITDHDRELWSHLPAEVI